MDPKEQVETSPALIKKEKSSVSVIGMIPHLSVIVIVLALLKQMIFYGNFHLAIKSFLNLSEVALIVSDDLLFITPILIVSAFIYSIISTAYLVRFEKKNASSEKGKKIISDPHWTAMYIISCILILVSICYLFIAKSYVDKIPGWLLLYVGSVCLLLSVFRHHIAEGIIGWNLTKSYYISILASSLVMYFVAKSAVEIRQVEHGRNKGTTITTSDTTYISNDSTYFIGKTEKYVFIYKVKDSGTLVIPTESVKQMFIKSK